jgi:hypothetical protein
MGPRDQLPILNSDQTPVVSGQSVGTGEYWRGRAIIASAKKMGLTLRLASVMLTRMLYLEIARDRPVPSEVSLASLLSVQVVTPGNTVYGGQKSHMCVYTVLGVCQKDRPLPLTPQSPLQRRNRRGIRLNRPVMA